MFERFVEQLLRPLSIRGRTARQRQTPANRDFVSASLGCYVYHPVFGFDFAAACKR